MDVRRKLIELDSSALKTAGGDGASLGDNVLAEFTAILTSNREDRDHDILEPKGATIDPKQALLWQHDPNQPIGKLLGIVERDDQKIVAKYAVLNTALGKDVLVLLKANALRMSHGFRPLEYEQRKGSDGGFHIRSWECVESSLVSIPSNSDAQILSLSVKSFQTPDMQRWFESITKGTDMVTQTQTPPTETKTGFDPEIITAAVEKGMTAAFATLTASAKGSDGASSGKVTPKELVASAAGGGTDVRVKSASSKFHSERRVFKHFKTGQSVFNSSGREPAASQLDYAKAGSFLRMLAAKAGCPCTLNELDKSLLEDMYANDAFLQIVGEGDQSYAKDVSGVEVKSLISDSVSGGVSVNPLWFDEMIVTFPLLSAELLPFVESVPMPRGAVADTASLATPTCTWATGGTVDGTEAAIFDTSGMVLPISSTVHDVYIAIEVGRNLLADADVSNLGNYVTRVCGERLAHDLDRVIAIGNATNEPGGIVGASGNTVVHSAGGNTAVNTLGDWESLMFGLAKQYRTPNCRFLSNDTTFARSRAIRVDGTTGAVVYNQLPVMSPVTDLKNYSTLGWPHSIQNDMSNVDAVFFNPAKYRLYRRQGLTFEWYRDGESLARRNTLLLVVRGRFAGIVTDGGGVAIMPDAKS